MVLTVLEQVEILRRSLPGIEELHLMGNMISTITVMFYFVASMVTLLLQVGYSLKTLGNRFGLFEDDT
jgi:hypothetical protein